MKPSQSTTRQPRKPGNQPATDNLTEHVGLAGINDCYKPMMTMLIMVLGKVVLAGDVMVVSGTAAIVIADERKGTECLD